MTDRRPWLVLWGRYRGVGEDATVAFRALMTYAGLPTRRAKDLALRGGAIALDEDRAVLLASELEAAHYDVSLLLDEGTQ